MSLDAALPLLRCPVCSEPLHRDAVVVRCASSHAFDVARQGYLNLVGGGAKHHGDTAAMVADRDRFLSSLHYAPIASAVSSAVAAAPDGPVLDLAAGTGWYAAQVLDAAPSRLGVAVDVSTPALRRAARAHPRLTAVGADAWGVLPVADGVFAAVLSVFGPRTAAQIARVLRPGGVVVVVTPTAGHLRELVSSLGMLGVGADKEARLRQDFAAFTPVDVSAVERTMTLSSADARALVGMGPTAHHVAADDLDQRVAQLADPVEVTLAVEVSVFRRP